MNRSAHTRVCLVGSPSVVFFFARHVSGGGMLPESARCTTSEKAPAGTWAGPGPKLSTATRIKTHPHTACPLVFLSSQRNATRVYGERRGRFQMQNKARVEKKRQRDQVLQTRPRTLHIYLKTQRTRPGFSVVGSEVDARVGNGGLHDGVARGPAQRITVEEDVAVVLDETAHAPIRPQALEHVLVGRVVVLAEEHLERLGRLPRMIMGDFRDLNT